MIVLGAQMPLRMFLIVQNILKQYLSDYVSDWEDYGFCIRFRSSIIEDRPCMQRFSSESRSL